MEQPIGGRRGEIQGWGVMESALGTSTNEEMEQIRTCLGVFERGEEILWVEAVDDARKGRPGIVTSIALGALPVLIAELVISMANEASGVDLTSLTAVSLLFWISLLIYCFTLLFVMRHSVLDRHAVIFLTTHRLGSIYGTFRPSAWPISRALAWTRSGVWCDWLPLAGIGWVQAQPTATAPSSLIPSHVGGELAVYVHGMHARATYFFSARRLGPLLPELSVASRVFAGLQVVFPRVTDLSVLLPLLRTQWEARHAEVVEMVEREEALAEELRLFERLSGERHGDVEGGGGGEEMEAGGGVGVELVVREFEWTVRGRCGLGRKNVLRIIRPFPMTSLMSKVLLSPYSPAIAIFLFALCYRLVVLFAFHPAIVFAISLTPLLLLPLLSLRAIQSMAHPLWALQPKPHSRLMFLLNVQLPLQQRIEAAKHRVIPAQQEEGEQAAPVNEEAELADLIQSMRYTAGVILIFLLIYFTASSSGILQ